MGTWRSAAITGCAAAILLVSATPAHASRSYGAFGPFNRLITMRTTDRADALQTAAMRVETKCAKGGYVVDFTDPLKVINRIGVRAPASTAALIRQRAPRGTLRYALSDRWEQARITGSLTLTRITARSARVRIIVQIAFTEDTCRTDSTLKARRERGVLYVGATDDHEPVWVRRQTPDSVEWIAGFGTDCQPRGFMEGLHTNALAMNTPTAFGWPQLMDGFGYFDFTQQVQIAGTFAGPRATGSFHIVGSGGPDNAERCDTGPRTWTATAT